MSSYVSVSLIIPSYNSRRTIARCLESVLAQNVAGARCEIIVVDSSDDGETPLLLQGFVTRGVKLITLGSKASPALGRNRGAREAQGSLLCFIDSDVCLADDWLACVLDAYRQGVKAGCGSVGIPIEQSRRPIALAQWYLQFNESLPVGKRRVVTMVPACNMFIDRGVFERAGGFPDLRASEDVLLCLRAAKETPIWFIPDARCFHVFREELKAYWRNQIILGKYIIIYRRQEYDRWFYQGIWPLLLLPAFWLIKLLRISVRIARAGIGHLARYVFSWPLFFLGIVGWGYGFARGCVKKGSSIHE